MNEVQPIKPTEVFFSNISFFLYDKQRHVSLPHCVNKLQYRNLRSNQMNFIQEHYNNKSSIQFSTQCNGLATIIL